MEAGVTRAGIVTAPGSVAEYISEEDALLDGFTLSLDRSQKGVFNPDALFARLKQLNVDEDGTVVFQLRRQTDYDTDSQATEIPSLENDVKEETLCREELQRHGGRPACSIETWIHIVDHPDEPGDLLLPWLQCPTDVLSKKVQERRQNSLSTVFTAQLDRWWEFEKWQWIHRDLSEGENTTFSRYFEARKKRQGTRHDPALDEFLKQGEWNHWDSMLQSYKPAYPRHDFAAHHKAIKSKLATYTHIFQTPLQLRKDPRKQVAWTTWLEYLAFELLRLEELEKELELRESVYNDTWQTFTSAAEEIMKKRQVPGHPTRHRPVKTLEEANQSLVLAETAIQDFVRRTATYRKKELLARQQRHRVKWIVEEARKMEKEIKEEHALKPRPRKREREKPSEKVDDALPRPRRSKRIRGNDGGQRLEKARATAASSQTGRRNTKRTKTS